MTEIEVVALIALIPLGYAVGSAIGLALAIYLIKSGKIDRISNRISNWVNGGY